MDETGGAGATSIGSHRRYGGAELTERRRRRPLGLGRAQFVPAENTLTPEIVLTSATADMAYAVFIERGQVGSSTDPIFTR